MKNEKNKVLTKDILAVCGVASKVKFKPEIACVQIKPDTIIATDCFKAIVIQRENFLVENYPNGELANLSDDGVLINAKELKLHLKFLKYKNLPDISEKALLIEKDKTVEILVADIARGETSKFNFIKVDGHYPDVEKIIPTKEPIARARINANYLIDLLKCFKGEEVDIEIRDDETPIVLKAKNKTGLLQTIEEV